MKNARASVSAAAMAGAAAMVSACADRVSRPAAAPSTEAEAFEEDTRVVAGVESVNRRMREALRPLNDQSVRRVADAALIRVGAVSTRNPEARALGSGVRRAGLRCAP